MFTILYLMVSFLVLGLLDIRGWMRISAKTLYLFSGASVVLSTIYGVYRPLFFSLLPVVALPQYYAIAASVAILALMGDIGFGDKIFLSSVFLLYPFWFVWVIFIVATLLTKPVFKAISWFRRGKEISLPFYPFLFLSALTIRYAGLEYTLFFLALLATFNAALAIERLAQEHRRRNGS